METSPELMEAGSALKVLMIGAFDEVTVSVAAAVELPAPLEAVSTYLVVEPGDTFFVPLDETVPISGSMETDVEPVTPQDTVALPCKDTVRLDTETVYGRQNTGNRNSY